MDQEHPVIRSHTDEPKSETVRERLLDRALYYVTSLANFGRLLLGLMLDERVDKKTKIFVGAVLAYIVAPIDFIPDLFSGLFGMLDDFVLSAFALNVILNWVDPEVVRAHWHGKQDLLATIQKTIKNAEFLVPEAIVRKIEVWIGKHSEKAIVAVKPAPVLEEEEAKPKRKQRKTRAEKPE